MHIRDLIFAGAICTVACSCRSDKIKKKAELKTAEFFATLRKGDKVGLSRLYPGFKKFDEYYKSDSGKIVATTESNKIVTVMVDNRFTNTMGKAGQEAICLYYKIDSIGRLVLYDSKGL